MKKMLSISLALGVLFNSSLPTFASTLSDDTRYEMFEDNNIMINDILESGKVDAEIEGNTLVNLVDGSKGKNKNNHATQTRIRRLGTVNLKKNVDYTLIVTINDITTPSVPFHGEVFYVNGDYSTAFDLGKVTSNGVYKRKINVLEDVNRFDIKIALTNIEDGKSFSTEKVMILEGDWTDKDVPEYFEDIKSVGQDDANGHKIEILSQNKNLYNHGLRKGAWTYGLNAKYNVLKQEGMVNGTRLANIEPIKVKPNTRYVFFVENYDRYLHCFFYDINGDYLNTVNYINTVNKRVTTPANAYYMCFFSVSDFDDLNHNVILAEDLETESFVPHQSNRQEISLSEPLRSLSDSIKDRIVKRNGSWYIERNIGQISGKDISKVTQNNINDNFIRVRIEDLVGVRKNDGSSPVINNIFPFGGVYQNQGTIRSFENIEVVPTQESGHHHRGICYLTISRDKANTLDEAKTWINNSGLEIVYQLEEPRYEPIKYESLELYLDTTHISTNSSVPANIKVTIDRVANRAKEFSEIAKVNPTSENISRARMWVNLMSESVLKDQIQEDVSNIANISDITLERKSVTANLDVYVKSENMLSMSLNTNSITFDGYSGTEDMEMLSAVNIAINSSLPYSLNAYMPSEITNTNKSETMPINILNIREESETAYQRFINTVDKIVLKDNCSKGNGISHGIDLKLSSDLAHKVDVYKTVIKFEAEQK